MTRWKPLSGGQQGWFDEFIALSSDAVISFDRSQRILFFNRAAEQIFGFEAREVLGRSVDLLLPEHVREIHRKHVGDFVASGIRAKYMAQRQEIMGQRKSGETFPAEASISRLEVNSQTMLLVVLRDISGRKEMEHRLLEAERTRVLMQTAGAAAHEIRQPLSVIMTTVEILMDVGELTADQSSAMAVVEQEIERINDILGKMESVSRYETKGYVSGVKIIDLDRAAEGE